MPTPKQTMKNVSRISIKRNGRVLAVTIEGSIAVLAIRLLAAAYIIHLLH